MPLGTGHPPAQELAKEGNEDAPKDATAPDANEIDIDDVEDVGEVKVPDEVFGSLAKKRKP